MLHYAKKEALAATQEEAKPITTGPIIKYAPSSPWTSVDKWPGLTSIFNMDNYFDAKFVEKFLTVYKPRETDSEGWIYVYERESDRKKLS